MNIEYIIQRITNSLEAAALDGNEKKKGRKGRKKSVQHVVRGGAGGGAIPRRASPCGLFTEARSLLCPLPSPAAHKKTAKEAGNIREGDGTATCEAKDDDLQKQAAVRLSEGKKAKYGKPCTEQNINYFIKVILYTSIRHIVHDGVLPLYPKKASLSTRAAEYCLRFRSIIPK